MKKTLLLLSVLCLSANAQRSFPFGEAYGKRICEFPKETILEQARMEFIYRHLTMDPEINKTEEEYDILMVGKKYALYKGYPRHRLDSILQHRDKSKITNKDYHNLFYSLGDENASKTPYILKHIASGKIEVHESIMPDNYIYEEPKIDFKWKLSDGNRRVCGHPCKKATCTFRGRRWTAWYAVDIPQSQGPWKFGGLAGLIMLIEDSKREHVFTVISVRKGTKDCLISQFDQNDFKTNRKWFNKAKRNYEQDPLGQLKTSGVTITNADGSEAKLPKKRLYVFNPIEKE